MDRQIRRIATGFVGGVRVFITMPFASAFIFPPEPAARPRKRHVPAPDVSRYFGATGGYLSNACRAVEERGK